MDEDDEFGDLYTDVLRPSSNNTSTTTPSAIFSFSATNAKSDHLLDSDDDEILYGSRSSFTEPRVSQSLESDLMEKNNKVEETRVPDVAILDSKLDDKFRGSDVSVSDSSLDAELRVVEDEDLDLPSNHRVSPTVNSLEKSKAGSFEGASNNKIVFPVQDDNVFVLNETEKSRIVDVGTNHLSTSAIVDVHVETGDDFDSDPVIPGLSSGPVGGIPGTNTICQVSQTREDVKDSKKNDNSASAADWDSDSEDDLHIVLNDNYGPPAVMGEVTGSDDDDEDLIIVADDGHHQAPVEDEEWVDEVAQTGLDVERKEVNDASKGNPVTLVAPRTGYGNHGYLHHSPFKYVRPGASTQPTTATSGASVTPPVNPPVSLNLAAGRGRGDWRPPLVAKGAAPTVKSFNGGFGLPGWGGSAPRPFGSGLEFTLPSHKTVFDVDIDSFEEKPWKYPGVDSSDYFNFGFDEDKWKEYCKQLEQLRLESTMQSKIRVYESGRSEQEYDPDLPPELAAATGIHDASVDNTHLGKGEGGQTVLEGHGRGTAHLRSHIPIGRAIQVETGCGERPPSIDTRPPRMRDSDAIIEIVLQDSGEDDANLGASPLHLENDSQGRKEVEDDDRQIESEYSDQGFRTCNGRIISERAPMSGSLQREGILPLPNGPTIQHPRSSKGQSIKHSDYDSHSDVSREGRASYMKELERSSSQVGSEPEDDTIVNKGAIPKLLDKNHNVENTGDGELPSPVTNEISGESRDLSIEHKDDIQSEKLALADSMEGEEAVSDSIVPCDEVENTNLFQSSKKQKILSKVEQPSGHDVEYDDLGTTQSVTSKARAGGGRDHQKRNEGRDNELIKEERLRHTDEGKRYRDDDVPNFRRRDEYEYLRDVRTDIDRSRMAAKGREDSSHSYSYRSRDSNAGYYGRAKVDGHEKIEDRDIYFGDWQRKDEFAYGRRGKNEDPRKRERGEESSSGHRVRVYDEDRVEKEYINSRKRIDENDWRGKYEKDVGLRPREKDINFIARHVENMDDPHIKRKKDEDLQRNKHVDKDEPLHSYRSREDALRRKRERDDDFDRRREDQIRMRDKSDDHRSVGHRDERQRLKLPYEELQVVHEKGEGRGSKRSGRTVEEKLWSANSEKEYQPKDKRRYTEQPKRRDREEATPVKHVGHDDKYEISNEERNPRHERSRTHNDHPIGSDSQSMHKEKYKENGKKSKDIEEIEQRRPEDIGGRRSGKANAKVANDHYSNRVSSRANSRDPGQSLPSTATIPKNHHHHRERSDDSQYHSTQRHKDHVVTDSDQQNTRKGRSKLERWSSHKSEGNQVQSPSSSSKDKDMEKENDGRSSTNDIEKENDGRSSTKELTEEFNQKSLVPVTNQLIHSEDEAIIEMNQTQDSQNNGSEKLGDRHLDTVEKLKKRSERFKLPMPSDKDLAPNKKLEIEPINTQLDPAVNNEIKPERPARKRRWVES